MYSTVQAGVQAGVLGRCFGAGVSEQVVWGRWFGAGVWGRWFGQVVWGRPVLIRPIST